MSLPPTLAKAMLLMFNGLANGVYGLTFRFKGASGNYMCTSQGQAQISSDYSTLNMYAACTSAISDTLVEIDINFANPSYVQTANPPPDLMISAFTKQISVSAGQLIGATLTLQAT